MKASVFDLLKSIPQGPANRQLHDTAESGSMFGIREEISHLREELKKEKQQREEADLILADHIAKISNLSKEKMRIEDAYSILYYCVVCHEQPRQVRFGLCGHVSCCVDCAKTIYDRESGRRCPICRIPITKMDTVFIA